MPSSLLRAKLTVALTAGAVGFGGLTAAAYTGVLPDGLQDLAHAALGAPAVEKAEAGKKVDGDEKAEAGKKVDGDEKAEAGKKVDGDKKAEAGKKVDGDKETPVGPDAAGPAAFGLCTAWANVQAHGRVPDTSVAFRNLAKAAGGANQITAYCAKIPHPGPSVAVKPSGHTGAKPSGALVKPSHPTGKPEGSR